MFVEAEKICPTTEPAKEAGLNPIEPLIESRQTLITLISNLSAFLPHVPLELQGVYLSFIKHLTEIAEETNPLTTIPEPFRLQVKDKLQQSQAASPQDNQPIPTTPKAPPPAETKPLESLKPNNEVREPPAEETISTREIRELPEYARIRYLYIWRKVKEGVDAGEIIRYAYGKRTRYGPKEEVLALVAPLLKKKRTVSMEVKPPVPPEIERSPDQQEQSLSADDLRLVGLTECAKRFCVDPAALQAKIKEAIRGGFLRPDECQGVTEEGAISLNDSKYPLHKVQLLADSLPKIKRTNKT